LESGVFLYSAYLDSFENFQIGHMNGGLDFHDATLLVLSVRLLVLLHNVGTFDNSSTLFLNNPEDPTLFTCIFTSKNEHQVPRLHMEVLLLGSESIHLCLTGLSDGSEGPGGILLGSH
jgi:hypothetical protein